MDPSVTFTEIIKYVYMQAIGIPSVALYGFLMMMYIIFVYHRLPGFVNILLFIILALPFLYDGVVKGAYYSVLIVIGATFVMGIVTLWRQG